MAHQKKGLANSNKLVTKSEDEFFDELNVSDDVKARLRKLLEAGFMVLSEMEVFAFDKFQLLNKTGSLASMEAFEAIARTGKIVKTTQFFANIVTAYQTRQDGGTSEEGEPFFSPNVDDVLALMNKMPEYQLEISNGQRKLSLSVGIKANDTAQVFVGGLNREAFEPDIVNLLAIVPDATIHELRIMMGYDGRSRGFAFVTFQEETAAERCKELLQGHEFMGKKLHVNVSVPIKRLFVGSLLRNKSKQEYLEEFERNGITTITDMIMHEPVESQKAQGQLNRGFCFIDFENHMAAAEVKKSLLKRTLLLFGRYTGIVDWADPVNDPGEETMSKVKILYAKGWKPETTENEIRTLFAEFGEIEKVKKINNFSFIHFADRENAVTAMKHFHGREINNGELLTVTLAKPDDPNAKLKKMQKQHHRNANNQMGQFQPMMAYGMQPYGARPQMMHPAMQMQMINPYMMQQGAFMAPGMMNAGRKRPYRHTNPTVTSVSKKPKFK